MRLSTVIGRRQLKYYTTKAALMLPIMASCAANAINFFILLRFHVHSIKVEQDYSV